MSYKAPTIVNCLCAGHKTCNSFQYDTFTTFFVIALTFATFSHVEGWNTLCIVSIFCLVQSSAKIYRSLTLFTSGKHFSFVYFCFGVGTLQLVS